MILAIDTSTSVLRIGFALDDGTAVAEIARTASESERGIHDARLAEEVRLLIAHHKISPKDISRVGIIVGPGSFTGLRIGLAFVKGFAAALQIPVIPLTTTEVLLHKFYERYGVGHPELDIILPSYRSDSVYRATSHEPNGITLQPLAEFKPIGECVLTTKELDASKLDNLEIISLDFDTGLFCRMIARSNNLVFGDTLDELEPQYVMPRAK